MRQPANSPDTEPVRLYAVLDAGPVRVKLDTEHHGFEKLYRGFQLGVYTVLRTYHHNCFLDLSQHLRRLRGSMLRFGMQQELDSKRLCRALHEVCSAYPAPNMRVRIDVLCAPATARRVQSHELIALAPFTAPDAAKYQRGVDVVTTRALQRADPLTKTASFAEQRNVLMARFPDAEDCLLVSPEGQVLEGASSNFYAVLNGVLRTAGAGVLEGVTRNIVLDLAHRKGIETRMDAALAHELRDASEAALSSSSRGLMPVTRIDGAAVGSGEVGPVMAMLHLDYEDFVARAARPAINRRQRAGGNR